ncbi:helix-turn-helix domain-containing protein [Shimia marina]|uniref:Anaerobic benzoate catabolism transcriptional regulator n=1 Tax=Shimia marina TaxID=321267 RepID=A0A0N7LRT4_9RHOB|nr:helix-turn-helix transcriptional regulator [Shimia marina]CUH51708.1 anaerobic benzoate catabolism transcriptional regulator [Shimia marina]SFE69641.1 DNA-binding transcriptional regulator, XRE-family HTH domain [Shimia marina]
MAVPIKMPRAARKELVALGENIRVARLRRKLTAEIVAQRAGTTRQTIAKIESGNPAVKIGTYVAVLQALGLLKGWGDLDDPVGEQMALDDLPQRARLKNG